MSTNSIPTNSGFLGLPGTKESTAGCVDLAWAFTAVPSMVDCRNLRAALGHLGINCRGLDDAQLCSDAERLVNLLVMGYLESQSMWPLKPPDPSAPMFSRFTGLDDHQVTAAEPLRTQDQDLDEASIPTPEAVDTDFSPSSFGSAFAPISSGSSAAQNK